MVISGLSSQKQTSRLLPQMTSVSVLLYSSCLFAYLTITKQCVCHESFSNDLHNMMRLVMFFLMSQQMPMFPGSTTLSPYYIHKIDKGYLICAQTHQSFEVYLNMYKKTLKYIEKLNLFSIV